MPKDALKTVEKAFLYQKNPFVLTGSKDRSFVTSNTAADQTDINLDARITAFKNNLFWKNYCSIPLGFLVDHGLINFGEKTETNFVFTLGRNMN